MNTTHKQNIRFDIMYSERRNNLDQCKILCTERNFGFSVLCLIQELGLNLPNDLNLNSNLSHFGKMKKNDKKH